MKKLIVVFVLIIGVYYAITSLNSMLHKLDPHQSNIDKTVTKSVDNLTQ